MTHCDVTITGHYHQEQRTRELIQRGVDHVEFAHVVSENPRFVLVRGDQKWDSDQK